MVKKEAPLKLMAVQESHTFTEDTVLGGKVQLRQTIGGYRAGLDAALLAAACDALRAKASSTLAAASARLCSPLQFVGRVAGFAVWNATRSFSVSPRTTSV